MRTRQEILKDIRRNVYDTVRQPPQLEADLLARILEVLLDLRDGHIVNKAFPDLADVYAEQEKKRKKKQKRN